MSDMSECGRRGITRTRGERGTAHLEDDVRGQGGSPSFSWGIKSKYIWLEPVGGVSENAAELELDQRTRDRVFFAPLEIFPFSLPFLQDGNKPRHHRETALSVIVSVHCSVYAKIRSAMGDTPDSTGGR